MVIPFFSKKFGSWTSLPARVKPDLYTYYFQDNRGYSRRVHLRIEENGGGILFLDVTDAIHLNETAALLASWALDGIAEKTALKRLKTAYFGNAKIATDVSGIYNLIRHVTTD